MNEKEYLEILKLVEVSRLYYEQEMTQAEIAKQLKISRPVVSKLLSEARDRGIVQINIKSPLESDQEQAGDPAIMARAIRTVLKREE